MESPSPSIRDSARRLLAAEAANPSAADPRVHEAVRVCETLRVSLTRFIGADGFTSLLRRAMVLAREEAPALHDVRQRPDGSLEGLEDLAGGTGDAAVAITAHLLALLVTFIGEPITVRLVSESWPAHLWANHTEVPRQS